MKSTLSALFAVVLLPHVFAAEKRYGDGTDAERTIVNKRSWMRVGVRRDFVKRGVITYQGPPASLDDGIAVGDARESGVDLAALVKLANKIEADNQDYLTDTRREPKGHTGAIDSMLIYVGGRLIMEEYFADGKRDKPHFQMSITKSVTALAVGKAIELGYIKGLDDRAVDYLPEVDKASLAPGADRIRIRDLLTMRSGLRVTRQGVRNAGRLTPDNYAQVILSKTAPVEPGRHYKYQGIDPDLLGLIIYRTSGLTVEQMVKKYFFDPMGIKRFSFGKGATGLTKTAAGLRLTSRDMLKLGILMMGGGQWQGRQLISKSFVEDAMRPWVNKDKPHHYGFFWWSHEVRAGGRTYDVKSARGAAGQFIFMVKDLGLIAVFTSYGSRMPFAALEKSVIPAVSKG